MFTRKMEWTFLRSKTDIWTFFKQINYGRTNEFELRLNAVCLPFKKIDRKSVV